MTILDDCRFMDAQRVGNFEYFLIVGVNVYVIYYLYSHGGVKNHSDFTFMEQKPCRI